MLIRTNGVLNDGSRQPGIQNHQLEYTETCASRLPDLLSTANVIVVLHSPEVSGLVSDGDLRSWSLIHSSEKN